MSDVRFLLVGLTVAVWTTSATSAQDQLSVRGLLAMAKIAGACGILDSQLHFQKTTRLEGGEQFVFRYWSTEATRLGKTLKEYSDQCNQAISGYEKIWQASPD